MRGAIFEPIMERTGECLNSVAYLGVQPVQRNQQLNGKLLRQARIHHIYLLYDTDHPPFSMLEEKRNTLASIVAGLFFFIGWWLIIDVQVTCSESFKGAYHLCGIFGTLSLFMVNSVSNAAIRGETGGRLGLGGARVWLFIGFVMGFAAIIAACWILFADFVTKSSPKHPSSEWAGSGLFLQNCFIFIASLVYKFGRVEDDYL